MEHNFVKVNGRTYCADCGCNVTPGSFEAFNHRGLCPYKASGKYFIPDDVRVREAIERHNFIPHAEVY
jgi:hypothetical protein